MFTTLLSIGSVVTILAHKTGDVPVWILWLAGYVALFVTAARIWHKEYREPGPKIDLECTKMRTGDDEFILYNRSQEDAYDVKIDDIIRDEEGHASFDSTKVRAGDRVSVKPIITKNPRGSLLFQSRLADFILQTADTPNLAAAFSGTVIPVCIEYKSIHGQWYRSTFKVTFFPHKEEIRVNLMSYRRVFKSFLAFPRLSKRGL